MIGLPRRGRGRQGAEAQAAYDADLRAFCDAILEIRSSLDFAVGSRGWCYLLEEHGLSKGDFDVAQRLINDCRKSGLLPLDIAAEDGARKAQGLEELDGDNIEAVASGAVWYVENQYRYYEPLSFWEGQPNYVEMMVEKIDLVGLFSRVCEQYRVPITNARGWSDINSRAAMMSRFAKWEREGNQPVLLYCGDHDPAGLRISDFLRSNFEDISGAVGWHPDNLVIDRFGLNADFIDRHGLTWIDGLATGNKNQHPLDDPRHPDHSKAYVQDYLRELGPRKVEANALVVRPEAGRELCRQAILRYVDADAPADYRLRLVEPREALRQAIIEALAR